MNRERACNILGIEETANLDEIKKKYRALIRQAHPDAKSFQKKDAGCPYSAQELNEAYDYLCEHPFQTGRKKDKHNTRTMDSAQNGEGERENWKAKENKSAYRARKIFYELRDEDEEKLGEICIAEGKFYWIEDEDFAMFLKSMFQLSKEILDEVDEEAGASMEKTRRFAIQAELSYLLSAQFLDGEYSLKHMNHGLKAGKDATYHFDAMLELNGVPISGDNLFPKRISRHKLYLQDEKGTEVGYLSFLDDRLYYVIIPLFEQRMVQVKIQLREENKNSKKKRIDNTNYRDLGLWLRFVKKEEKQLQESMNMQIEKLLSKYKNAL